MSSLKDQLLRFPAYDEREEKDIHAFIQFIDAFKENVWTRDNCVGHVSSSAWVLNRDHTHVLMAYHNIFQNKTNILLLNPFWGIHLKSQSNPVI